MNESLGNKTKLVVFTATNLVDYFQRRLPVLAEIESYTAPPIFGPNTSGTLYLNR